MTYEDYYGARLLVAERRYGAPFRSSQRAEIAKVEATKAAIRHAEKRSA